MDGPATVSELLNLLGSGLTPHDLAESMSNPLWYVKTMPIETDIAIAITAMHSLLKRSRKEIQHALIDECIAPPDPSDIDRQEFILEQMRQFIPAQANVEIIANIVNVYANEADESESNVDTEAVNRDDSRDTSANPSYRSHRRLHQPPRPKGRSL
jgi:hypothetical protein